ncbi:MAG TPA: nuclear transport factor 2 family protein [Candidatus Krumholzibacteria bacterium]|nr:nuclear transport factor 2 family protein [Candidatus Krumholzibacteria bacterium]
MKRLYGMVALLLMLASSAFAMSVEERTKLENEVKAAENAFAKTLADRDHKAFARFIADDAAFFGRNSVSRGKEAVVASWAGLFEGPTPPFSWASEAAVVLESGTLALSYGPVYAADGKRFGTFNSVWRREKDGTWKVIFDKGCDYCEAGTK